MKIDKECIDYNVTRLIDEYTKCVWEVVGDNEENNRLMMLGYIRGVLEMGEAMKEVLKS